MKRIGIFGGSFNPVHNAHLALAAEAKKSLRLDQILFVPCNRSAYRKKLLPARLRLRMLRLALKGRRGFKASDIEIRLGGVSRSIETLRALRPKFPEGTKFFLLIGGDQAKEFPHWKEAETLSGLLQICVMARPGFRKSALIHRKFHFRTVKVSQYDISSTEIRHRLLKDLPLDGLIPKNILSLFKSCRNTI